MRILIALFWLYAAPLWAEVALPNYAQLTSKLGLVTVQQVNDMKQVFVGGQPIPQMSYDSIYLHGIYNHTADGSQTILLTLHNGGNACFDVWAVIRIAGGQILPSGQFGGCSTNPEALRVDGSGLEIDLPMSNPRYAYATFRFDGRQFTKTEVLRARATQIDGDGNMPPFDVTRWIGRHSYDLYKDSAELSRFDQVADVKDVDLLTSQTAVGNNMFSDGKYLYGYGCMPHQCNSTNAAFAIEIATGWPRFVFYGNNGQRQFRGDRLEGFPTRLQVLYNTGTFPK